MDNLKCANESYMTTFEKYQEGVESLSVFTGIYNNACTGKPDNHRTDITIPSVNTKDGKISIILNKTCEEIKNKVLACEKEIKNQDDKYSAYFTNQNSAYNVTKDGVVSRYNTLTDMRKKLDQDVLKVLGADNSPMYEKQSILDSAVYTTLLWTVLATSVLYYTFTKI